MEGISGQRIWRNVGGKFKPGIRLDNDADKIYHGHTAPRASRRPKLEFYTNTVTRPAAAEKRATPVEIDTVLISSVFKNNLGPDSGPASLTTMSHSP